MIKYIFKKSLYTITLFITVIFISFFTMKVIPGDPVDAMFEKGLTPELRKLKEKELGLDKPLKTQFINYFKNIFIGDFGKSYYGTKEPVFNLFTKAFTNTFKLAFLSCFFGSLLGIFLGALSAFYEGSKKSFILDFYSIIIISSPIFIIGILLQLTLGHYLRLFPVADFDTPKHVVLPILTLSLLISGSVFKTTKTSMEECLSQPYIKTAYSKGLSKKNIIFKHALKNALIPVVAHIGLLLSFLIGGSIITENIFEIKGVGVLIKHAFDNRNYPVIQCCIILLALFIAIWNLFLDLVYVWLDPKIKQKG
ncbi:MAG: ABC transporter permease [Candidatus Phytoplasma asteris]|nr:ABC transporter permease ['Chrysanthemum coronarium' phytoplasma]TKA87603.1 MAG: ABC-type peptide/nickel transport system permease protein [Periwinkle leaf yellowing phytoplasma]WEX19962.1 MAG: ABC transporter permease [Candidatus Phytoplasma asteris]